MGSEIESLIKTYAKEKLGIDKIGFCDAKPLEAARQNLQEFLDQGFQGEMKYLENPEVRTNPQQILPNAKSVIVIVVNYYREKPETPEDHGRIARYAWGRDYHKVLKTLLKDLQKFLDHNWPEHQHKLCVDSAPILEKAYAEQAGIGFYGKNTTLITPEFGSFVLLGEIITTLSLKSDQARGGTCGTCTRCMEACPTQALIAPGKMDARRCISYLTLESKQPIPNELAKPSQNLIAGCDICQEVCPYNIAFAKPLTLEPLKAVKIAGDAIPLIEILQLKTTEDHLKRFAGSPLMRPKRYGLIKNALNAAQNALQNNYQKHAAKFLPIIQQIAQTDKDERLRELAKSVVNQLKI